MTDRDKLRLVGVEPKLVVKISSILAAMEALGFPMFVVMGLRTTEEQRALFMKGRKLNGDGTFTVVDKTKVVTNADGRIKISNHQASSGFGHSVDCAFIDDPETEKIETWDVNQPWDVYGTMGEALDLYWGGRWPGLVDRPHLSDRRG